MPTSGSSSASVNWWPVSGRAVCTSARSRAGWLPTTTPVVRCSPIATLITAASSTTCSTGPDVVADFPPVRVAPGEVGVGAGVVVAGAAVASAGVPAAAVPSTGTAIAGPLPDDRR